MTEPDAPTAVNAMGGNGSATVSWTAPASNGAAITGYTVTAEPGGATATTTGATNAVVNGLDNGSEYTFTVTATNSVGTSLVSDASTPVTLPLLDLEVAKPVITGQAIGRRVLRVTTPGWTRGTHFSYQWYADDEPIANATGPSLTLKKAQWGTQISVGATGTLKGYSASDEVVSDETSRVSQSSKPKIAGAAKIGKKLTAHPGHWTKGMTFTYSWYADGKPIKGQHHPALRLKKSMEHKHISVRVMGHKHGYTTATEMSKRTHPVEP